jgi:uncharacterized membrane protein (DUF373 family)
MEKLKQNKFILVETVAVGVITLMILFGILSISQVISTFLIFMILLEVVRMIREFIITSTIKLSIVIDSFIMFFIRDVVLIVSNEKKYSFNEQIEKVVFFIALIFIFFIFRIMSLRFSPNDKNCEKCPVLQFQMPRKDAK